MLYGIEGIKLVSLLKVYLSHLLISEYRGSEKGGFLLRVQLVLNVEPSVLHPV